MRHLTCLFVFITAFCFSQKENNLWYFGYNAAIDFNSSPPTKLLNNVQKTEEGCVTVSDSLGNLLFYTSGDSIYGKNHICMPNGFNLTPFAGAYTMAQSVSAIRKPGSKNLYYIFSTDSKNGYYAIIDMNLNGGFGDVILKQKHFAENITEAMLVAPHKDCGKYWIICQGNDIISHKSYLFDGSIVDTNAIVSYVGTNIPVAIGGDVGMLALSLDNKKIASTLDYDTITAVFDFDASTGLLSNQINIHKPFAYSVCFSPNGKLLYLSADQINLDPGPKPFSLYQYDLSSNNEAIINSSFYLVDTITQTPFGDIKVAPDNKMYVSIFGGIFNVLPVINNPDVFGVGCNYSRVGIDISPNYLGAGLPSKTYSTPIISGIGLSKNMIKCSEDDAVLKAIDNPNYNYLWNTGSTSFSISAVADGKYWVRSEYCQSYRTDTIIVENVNAANVIPNVFTPNNDLVNDVYKIESDCFTITDYSIYNRWGNLIKDEKSDAVVWDGKINGNIASNGVYYIVFNYVDKNEVKHSKKTFITLLN
ncbi:MAG: gliding motility-associated C-terminal domain-containing protein [Bacteroidia bacterium]|nr:gliding motility-associated C-terminal domain-containing protein [Bacteroidia bacterium]